MELIYVGLYVTLASATVYLLAHRYSPRRSGPLPPGPPRLPIVGNYFNRPLEWAALAYTEMKAQYGDIISLELFGQPIIVLNSSKVSNDLFERRSTIYNDRPALHLARYIFNWFWNFCFMRYSDAWRFHRKTFHQYFQQKKVADYHPIQLEATRVCLKQMLVSPDGFFGHIRHHSGSVILQTTYGYTPDSGSTDEYVEKVDKALRGLQFAVLPGTYYLLDVLPFLKHIPSWLPFAGFKRRAQSWGEASLAVRDEPFDMVLEAMRKGTATPCFTVNTIENSVNEPNVPDGYTMMDVIKNCAALAFVGGADTNVSVNLGAILAVVNRPDVKAKAHAELDRVVGRNRLPNFGDFDELKYIQAIILEVMRWRPVTHLALSHACAADDVYEGYMIPAGSIVLGNAWAILHDEEIYKDASTFNPERFLGANPEPDPATMGSFGFGRRICPGRFFAMNTSLIIVASILWAFDVKPPSEDGSLVDDSPKAWTDGFLSHPLPFKCKFVPRFEGVEELINSVDA